MANDFLKEVQRQAANEFYSQQNNSEDEIHQFMGQFGITPKQPNPETENNGLFGWIKDGFDSGAAGVFSGTAHMADTFTPFGADTAEYFDDVAKSNARDKEYSAKDIIPFASDYYTNPQGFAYDAGNQVGSMAAMYGEGAAIMAAASALGVGTLGSIAGALAARASAAGFPAAARVLNSRFGPLIAANLAKTPLESVSESGGVAGDLKEKGATLDEQQKAAITNFLIQTPLLTLSNTIEGMGLGGIIGAGAKTAGKKALLGAAGMVGGAAQQSWEEGMQRGASDYSKGEQPDGLTSIVNPFEWSNGQFDEAAAAFGPGMLFGGAGAVGGRMANKYLGDKSKQSEPEDSIETAEIVDTPDTPTAGARTAPLAIGNDVEDYDGVNDNVKAGANAFGQLLRDKYGIEPEITSGKRSAENNASVGGAENSYHLSGDAVDLYVGDLSDEQAAQVKADAEANGWGEVLFHDAGSGKHLHLANYQGESNGQAENTAPVYFNNANDAYEYLYDKVGTFDDAETNNRLANILDNGNDNDVLLTATEFAQKDGKEPLQQNVQAKEENTAKEEISGNDRTYTEEEMQERLEQERELADSISRDNSNIGKANKKFTKAQAENRTSGKRFIPEDYYDNKDKFISTQNKVFTETNALSNIAAKNKNAADKSGYEWKQMELKNRQYRPIGTLIRAAQNGRGANVNPQLVTTDNDEKVKKALASPIMNNLAKKALSGDKDAQGILNKLNADVRQALVDGVKKTEFQPGDSDNASNAIKNAPKGNSTRIRTDDGTEFDADYKLVEADNLITSHSAKNSEDFAPNPAYPKELQPRDRNRVAMKSQIDNIVNKLRPEDLGESRSVNQGAPIINSNGVVENGNGRSIALTRMYKGKAKTAPLYRKFLKDNAEKFGISPEQIDKMSNPILVRERKGDVDVKKITTSTEGGAKLGAGEQANVDAGKIKASTLEKFVDSETGDLLTAANKDFVKSVISDISSDNDLNELLDSNGNVSQYGIARIKNALFAMAYKDNGLLAKMAESNDNNIKNIINGLLNATPYVAQVTSKIKEGNRYKLDISTDVVSAAEKLMTLRDEGKPVSVFMQETSMFGDDMSDGAKDILTFFDKNKQRPKQISNMLKRTVTLIDKLGDPKQTTMFEEVPIPSINEIYNIAIGGANNERQSGTLAGKQEEPIRESGVQSSKTGSPSEVSTVSRRGENTEVRPDKTAVHKNDGVEELNQQEENIDSKNVKVQFSDFDTAKKAFEEVLGIKKAEKATESELLKSIDNSDEARAKAKKKLLEALNNISANPMFNPELHKAALNYGLILLKDGVNSFANFSKQMIEDIGEQIRPWVGSVWKSLEVYPKNQAFDADSMSKAVDFTGVLYNQGYTTPASIYDYMEAEYGKDVADNFKLLVESAFAGVDEVFNPTLNKQENINNSDSIKEEPKAPVKPRYDHKTMVNIINNAVVAPYGFFSKDHTLDELRQLALEEINNIVSKPGNTMSKEEIESQPELSSKEEINKLADEVAQRRWDERQANKKQVAEREKRKEEALKNSGAKFNENKEQNGFEISFDKKPADDILKLIKENGFRWSRNRRCWYVKKTDEIVKFAETLGYKPEKVVQSNQDESTEKEGVKNDRANGAGTQEMGVVGTREDRGRFSERENTDISREDENKEPSGSLEGTTSKNDTATKETGDIGRGSDSKVGTSGREDGISSELQDVRDGRKGTSGTNTSPMDGESGRGNERGVKKASSTVNGNYHIDDPDALIGGTPKVRFSRNKAAIEAIKSIMDEGREATAEEKDAMAAYTGWGSFGQELFNGSWANTKPKEGWEEESAWLKETLGEEAWKSAQSSILNAHYTDPATVSTIWKMVERMGFKGGKVLEPSMGVGNFFGLMPKKLMANSNLTGIELDITTGNMAKILYPNANVQIKGYQDSKTADNFYDLIIGNVPFDRIAPNDRRYNKLGLTLHDYFFVKGLDQLRPGGVMIAITSKGTMDKVGRQARIEMAKKAVLVDAYRLPTGAFDKYAGTSVVADILVFQKREEPTINGILDIPWVNTTEHDGEMWKGEMQKYHVNNFFEENPDKVLGEMGYGTHTTDGRPGLVVERKEDFAERLAELPSNVPLNIIQESKHDKNIHYIANNTTDMQNSLVVNEKDDSLYVVNGEHLIPANEVNHYEIKDKKKTEKRKSELKLLISLRKAYGQLVDAERSGDSSVEDYRKQLNKIYKDFTKNYGNLTESYSLKYLKNIHDPYYNALSALEDDNGKPATIFKRATIRSAKKIENPTIKEAFIMARNESKNLNIERVAELSKKSVEDVKKELVDNGTIFKTPNETYEVADVYLSGNVRIKLREAEEALKAGDNEMKKNIEELKKVIPATVPYYNIEASLGASWINADIYKEFISHLLKANNAKNVIELKQKAGGWSIKVTDKGLSHNTQATNIFGTGRISFNKLITHAFNHGTPVITMTDPENPKGNKIPDQEAINAAVEKIEKIYDEFSTWLWSDQDRKISLENDYNEAMNCMANPKYDGSFMEMVGMALQRGKSAFNLRKHQLDAIYRGIINGSGIFAHEVGTGKTYTMAGIALESRRYGISKKPLILAHNANSAAVSKEINDMYPGAKVLYIDNLDKGTIERKLNQIKTDDWDVIVMPHSQIDKLALTKETLYAMAADRIAALEEAAIEAAKDDGVNLTVDDMDSLLDGEAISIRSTTAKDLVRQRNKILITIMKQAEKSTKEGAITFEELGIDSIIVDEAHEFKKPPFVTKRKMKGLNASASDRSIKLNFLTEYVQSINNGKGVYLFTGTPITNTLVEMFHMMRYVMPSEMKTAGVYDFDSWFNVFASEVSDVEVTSTGEYANVSRLAAFTNVPELRRMAGQYLDIVFANDMPEFKDRETKNGKTLNDKTLTESERNELINGRTEDPTGRPYKKIINDVVPLNETQESILKELIERAKKFANANKKERKRMMNTGDPAMPIRVETDANNTGMDARLYDINLNPVGDSKEQRCVKNVVDIYNEHPKTTQVIFMDRGLSDTKTVSDGIDEVTRKKRSHKEPAFNLSKSLAEKLVKQGIKRDEIIIMRSDFKPEKRAEIAEKLKKCEYRVIIGSSATLGVGVNMQDNLRAMHHLDAPWMPGILEQRNGRGHRQGNKWNTVFEVRYISEKLDGKRWQSLTIKDKFIKSFLKADESVRSLEGDAVDMQEGDESATNDFAETLSKATGDPRILYVAKYKADINKLERKERTYIQGIEDTKRNIKYLENTNEEFKTEISNLEADTKQYQAFKEKEFSIELAGSLDVHRKKPITFTERAKANEHLQQILAQIMGLDTAVSLGKIGGFDLSVTKRSNFFGSNVGYEVMIKGNGIYQAKGTIASITSILNNLPKTLEQRKEAISKNLESIKSLESATKQPFPHAENLAKKKKALADMEQDLLDSPIAPPSWLVQAAPIDSDIYIDGDKYNVTGHKANEKGFYIVAENSNGEKVFPYQLAKDSTGMFLYESSEHGESAPYVAPKKDNASTDNTNYQVAFHGSPYIFDSFDLSKIGMGEGAQVHGWGLYFAQNEETAKGYRDIKGMGFPTFKNAKEEIVSYDEAVNMYYTPGNIVEASGGWDKIISYDPETNTVTAQAIKKRGGEWVVDSDYPNPRRYWSSVSQEQLKSYLKEQGYKNNGSLFEVDVPDNDVLLDEQKPFSKQSLFVKKALRQLFKDKGYNLTEVMSAYANKNPVGGVLYGEVKSISSGDAKEASMTLNKYGIKGITYEGNTDGRCFVVFDDKAIQVMQKYEVALNNNKDEILRSLDELKAEALKAFPSAKNIEIKDNVMSMDMPNGTKISVVLKDKIIVDGKDAEKARKDHGITQSNKEQEVQGYSRKLDKGSLIALSQASRKGTAFHEAFHTAWDWALTDKEKAAMLKYFNSKTGKANVYEHMANFYAKWHGLREQKRGTVFGKLFQKIYDFAKKMQSILTGVDNVHNVLRKLESGEAWENKKNSDKQTRLNEAKYAMLKGANDYDKNFYVDAQNKLIYQKDDTSATDNVQYSVRTATENLIKNLKGNKELNDRIEVRAGKTYDKFNLLDNVLRSPSYLAQKFPKLKLFFKYSDEAMNEQEKIRGKFQRIMKRANDLVKNKEERSKWQELLWRGDVEGKEFTNDELREQGYSDNVIKAYNLTRNAIRKAYNLLNDAKKQVRLRQEVMNASKLRKLRNNKFASDVKATVREDGDYIVSWKEAKSWEKEERVSKEFLNDLEEQDNIQVLSKMQTASGDYVVKYRESVGDIANKEGYIPHFFHDYFIMDKKMEKDENGNEVAKYTVLGSGRTLNEATAKAEKMLKDDANKNRNIVVQPKSFSFDGDNEKVRAAIIGDTEYQTILKRVSEEMEMSVQEAKDLLTNKEGLFIKGRHRFFGNMLKRKGAEGFEQDMDWVLNHYFNSVGRYVAMESFKPKAIGLFERYFGRFDNDYSNNPLANYIKQYINDMNGNPSALENIINNMLNNSAWYRKHVVSNYGDRAALQVAGNITGKISILKLGFLNVSSALLNLSQIMNVVGLTGDMAAVRGAIAHAIKPTMSDKKIYSETGILNNIAMDSAGGYGKFTPGKVASKTMYLFTEMDRYARKVAVLAAYHKGIKDGMNHKEAINYAKEVNKKANFDYGVADAPNLFRRSSVIGQLALQFKKYPIKELELMYEIATKGSREQNLKFWGSYFLVCGLLQFPGADWFDEILKDIFGFSPKNNAKEAIFKAAGNDPISKELAKIAIYGLGAAANIDMSKRAGIGNVTPTIENGWKGLLGGPTASTGYQAAKGIAELFRSGNPLPTIKALSHTLGNYYAATVGYSEGKRGRTTSSYEDAYARTLKAAGFRSVDESIASDKQEIINDNRKERTSERAEIIDKVLAKQQRKEKLAPDDVRELKRLGITGKQLSSERAKKRMDNAGRLKAGMSKKEIRENRDLLNF